MAVKRRMWLSSIGSWNDGVLEWWNCRGFWRNARNLGCGLESRPENSVSARRRNQHARRVRYPEGMRAIGVAGTQGCLPVRPAGILPAAKVSRSASLSDATDAVGAIMPALPVAAGFKPAGRTGRRPVFLELKSMPPVSVAIGGWS